MSLRYSAILSRCMLVSAIGLTLGIALPVNPLVPFALGLAPLVWYHLAFLRRHAGDGISQSAVDSVYYFGFLITIGALGASALRLGIQGTDGNFGAIAMQFGLGLLATGYAVWARMDLTASSPLLDETNLEEAMNRYVERSRELVANAELASSSFRAYADTLVSKSEEYTTRIHEDTNVEIKRAAQVFRDVILNLSEEGRLALQSLRAVVNDVKFGSEREELRKGVTAMTATVTALTTTLNELRASSSAGASSIGEFAGGLASVGARAQEATERLGQLSDQNGAVPKLTAALGDSLTKIEELNLSVDVAAISVTKLSDSTTAASVIAAEFSTQSGKAVRSMRGIASATERMNELSDSFSNLEKHLQALAGEALQSDNALSGTRAKVEELGSTLEHINTAIADATGGLKDALYSISSDLEFGMKRLTEAVDLYAARVKIAAASASDEIL